MTSSFLRLFKAYFLYEEVISVRIYVISIILKNFIILLKMDYDLVAKMHVNELKNYLKVRGLKISGNRNELVDRVFIC